jgi:UDP-N-acetylmuramoylalanine--D-glutamate ligase
MTDWSGRKVVIVGAARQGTALARYLIQRGAQVVLTDCRPAEELADSRQRLQGVPVRWVLGGHPLSLLEGADVICLSGGVPLSIPLVQAALERGIPLSNDSQIFLEEAPCKVIGITGSAGKSTTTALVGRIAESAAALEEEVDGFRPRRVWVGGNIGDPLLNHIDEMAPDDLAVMELSSFQLELMTRAPQIAGLLNITPNHLDRHKTMAAYTAAKARILTYQKVQDIAVLGREDPGAWELREHVRGRLLTFGFRQPAGSQFGTFLKGDEITLRDELGERSILRRDQVELLGEHNMLNVLAACGLAAVAGLPIEAMRLGVQGFKGIPHRLEYVRTWGGADWYNDSIATAPERSVAAMRSFDRPLVLLAGGRDKNLPWEGFAREVRRRVDHLILFGEAAGLIERAVGSVAANERPYSVHCCTTLEEAVRTAAQVIQPGDVVLLSPGGTSFDAFRDFEERGERFRQWVQAL